MLKYKFTCWNHEHKEYQFEPHEAFTFISNVYADLSNRYRLIEQLATTDLVLGQAAYTAGIGATNIPLSILDIKRVVLNDAYGTPLEKYSISETAFSGHPTGLPTRFSIDLNNDNKILTIDTVPDQSYTAGSSYRLNIVYYLKIIPYSGAADGTFTGIDFSKSGFGGNFLTDTIWDDVIVLGTLANVLPDIVKIGRSGTASPYKLEFERKVQELLKSKPINSSSKVTYNLGV